MKREIVLDGIDKIRNLSEWRRKARFWAKFSIKFIGDGL